MSKVFLINVGANTGHKKYARSPLFDDGSFQFVSFPEAPKGRAYPAEMQPFVRDVELTHLDPDWINLTYGDYCKNPRAFALRGASENDILLFWGLFWAGDGQIWDRCDRRWCLFGALRIRQVLKPRQRAEEAEGQSRIERAKKNMHFSYGNPLKDDHHVFIGCTKHSRRFAKAVDLGVDETDGLLYRTIRTAAGASFTLNGKPSWKSSLRSCRVAWDMGIREEQKRAEVVRDAIRRQNEFDMFAGL